MKIIGILYPSALSLACNSKPDMPGIRISTIRHTKSGNWPDFNKSLADPNETASKPEAFDHAAQFSGATGVHLTHHVPAMNGCGYFAGPECCGDLLCLHAGNHEFHHFTFACR